MTTRTTTDPTETILSESALNNKHLCDYVINVATGCKHGCKFCYVPNSPNIRTRGEMLSDELGVEDGQKEWGDYVLYRTQIPEELPGILDRKRTWKETEHGQGIVMLSSGTDSFMDDRAGNITIQTVQALADHNRHIRILTRNPLLASRGRIDTKEAQIDLPSNKYIEVLESAAEQGYLTVGSSINTLNPNIATAIEPGAPIPQQRLNGLKELSDQNIPVYISMSPTYPTMDRTDINDLLDRLAKLNPEVIFHEIINPRGGNFELTIEAAQSAGCKEEARELSRIKNSTKDWVEYGLKHYQWVQELCNQKGLPLHIWPDKKIINNAPKDHARWLNNWYNRQSSEPFANRPSPDTPQPKLPQTLSSF